MRATNPEFKYHYDPQQHAGGTTNEGASPVHQSSLPGITMLHYSITCGSGAILNSGCQNTNKIIREIVLHVGDNVNQ